MLKITVLLCVIVSLLGCSYWPPPSKGGYAAHYLFYPRHFRCNGPFSLCQINTDRLAIGIHELNILRYTNLVRCHPARYVELRLLEQQISQEIAAQLYLSARLDLNLFYINLQHLKQLSTPKGCMRIKHDNAWDLLKLRIQ